MGDGDTADGAAGSGGEHDSWCKSVFGVDPGAALNKAASVVADTASAAAAGVAEVVSTAATAVTDTVQAVETAASTAVSAAADAASNVAAPAVQAVESAVASAKSALGGPVPAATASIGTGGIPHTQPLSPEQKDLGAGLATGVVSGLTPFGVGGLVHIQGEEKHKNFEIGRGLGEMISGIGQVALGASGEVVGGLLDMTGIGALVGVPVNVASAAIIASGASAVAIGAVTAGSAVFGMGGGESGGGGGEPPNKPPTETTLPDEAGGEVKGPFEPTPPDNPEKVRDLQAQEEALQAMAKKGYKIDRNPKKSDFPELSAAQTKGNTDPDAPFRDAAGNPKAFGDVYSPTTAPLNNIYSNVETKTLTQGPNVVVNLKNSPYSAEQVVSQFREVHPNKLKELFVMAADGTITHLTF